MIFASVLALFSTGAAAPMVAGIGSSTEFSMSADGNIIASCSSFGGKGAQVVMKNFTTKQITLLSTLKGAPANKSCTDIFVSAAGDATAFTSCATNLGANDEDGYNHVFVWDGSSKSLRVASKGMPKIYNKAILFNPTVSNRGTMTMFQSQSKTLPTRVWISEAGKAPQTLAARLNLGTPIEQDYCGTISADGKQFFAIVKDAVYNKGERLENPIMISGSFESGEITRTPLPQFRPSSIFGISNLKISADGSVIGFGEVSKEGSKWAVSYLLCDLKAPTYDFRRILTRTEGHSYYASAFTFSGNGSVIVYQRNPDGEAYFGDQILAYNWRTGTTDHISVSTRGVKAKKTLTLGYNGVNMHAISCDWDCSKVTFVSCDPLGAFSNSHGGTTAEILVRDVVNRKTYLLQ